MDLKTLQEPRFMASIIEANELEIEKYQNWLGRCSKPLQSDCEKMIQRLTEENERLARRSEAIQQAVKNTITDKEVIEIIRLYLLGKGWSEIAMKVYNYSDYQVARKRCERAVAKIPFE